MNKVIIIWGVILIVFFESCVLPLNQEWVGLNAVNTSNDSILIYLARGHQWSPTVYPDTLLPKDTYVGEINLPHTNDSISGYLVPLAPHDTTCVELSLIYCDDWKHGMLDKFFADFPKITSWFFISADSVEKYGYDYVATHNIILARYDLTTSDMKYLNMMIPYPPTEGMKGMKIWMSKNNGNSGASGNSEKDQKGSWGPVFQY